MKSFFLDPFRRLLPSAPALAPAPAGGVPEPMRFASSGGGGGGRFDDPDDDYLDDDPATPENEETTRPARRTEQQATAARRRTVQSEPDDRYWTDYLRIALPVIGLLLVIAVFWFWAQQLIGDDTDTDLTSTTEAGLVELADNATEPAAEVPGTPAGDTSGDAAQPTTDPATQPTTDPATQPTTEPAAQPTTEPVEGGDDAGDVTNALLESLDDTGAEGGGGEITADSTVVVSAEADTLNLRSDPTAAEENIVATLTAGTELTVVSGPTEAETYIWWEVLTPDGQTGWVVEDFIEPAA